MLFNSQDYRKDSPQRLHFTIQFGRKGQNEFAHRLEPHICENYMLLQFTKHVATNNLGKKCHWYAFNATDGQIHVKPIQCL